MKIDDDFASGALVHPLSGPANSVDLFRTMSQLSGGQGFPATEATGRLTESIGHHDHYLFVLVDGLGINHAPFPTGGFLASAERETIHAVFPSTTAVALTSLATGAWPAEHGLAGWHTYFPEHRRVIMPLWFRERGTDARGEQLGLSMEDLVGEEPLLGSFFRSARSVMPTAVSTGEYANWSRAGTPIFPYRSFAHAVRVLRRLMRRPKGPTYTYLYILTVDKYSHSHGVASDRVAEEIAQVDALLTRLRDALPANLRMVVTADHGLIDVPQERRLVFRDSDAIARHLIAGQTGESTTPVFHVKSGRIDAFREEFAAHPASAWFDLYTPAELAERRLYGPVPLGEAATLHLGDLVGIAVEPTTLSYVPEGKEPLNHVGVHGGLRPQEMLVPLMTG